MLRIGLALVALVVFSFLQELLNLKGIIWETLSLLAVLGLSLILPEAAWEKALKWYWKVLALVIIFFASVLLAVVISNLFALSPMYSILLASLLVGLGFILAHFIKKYRMARLEQGKK